MLLRILILLASLAGTLAPAAEIHVIPRPAEMVHKRGLVTLPGHAMVTTQGKGLEKLTTYCEKTLASDHGIHFGKRDRNAYIISLEVNPGANTGKEGYSLETGRQQTSIKARSEQGIFYGIQTLRQLIRKHGDGTLVIPRVNITDSPRFPWRGMHLDVSRHFFPKEFIKKFIDHLAAYKMNVFHWHLVDGPGWRIEIKKYPRLTGIGAWRKDKTSGPWNWRATEIDPKGKQPDSYGGYYTQDDIREIVAYAAERHITVVPEIEMPGHSYAILAAYPEFACPTNNIMVDGLRGKDVFCVGNEKTYRFLQDILDETMALFPSPYIHIGADEVPTSAWKECPRCQALKDKHRLASEKHLQSHFVTRMEQYIHSKGRTMLGWDEVIGDKLPARAAVMVWRDKKFVHRALAQNHPVVMSPGEFCYFDQYQSKSRKGEFPAIGGFLPTRRVYDFDPVPAGLAEEKQKLILGGQGNVWTEYIQTPAQVETRILPRMCALAEAVWTPPNNKDWDSFEKRIQTHKATWEKRGIKFYRGSLDGK